MTCQVKHAKFYRRECPSCGYMYLVSRLPRRCSGMSDCMHECHICQLSCTCIHVFPDGLGRHCVEPEPHSRCIPWHAVPQIYISKCHMPPPPNQLCLRPPRSVSAELCIHLILSSVRDQSKSDCTQVDTTVQRFHCLPMHAGRYPAGNPYSQAVAEQL